VNNLLELAGYGLVIAFLWFVWPPLVLLGAGVLLVVAANVRAGRGREGAGRLAAAVSAAFGAARRAYRQETAGELRRVACHVPARLAFVAGCVVAAAVWWVALRRYERRPGLVMGTGGLRGDAVTCRAGHCAGAARRA
jgi:hypothetical protein